MSNTFENKDEYGRYNILFMITEGDKNFYLLEYIHSTELKKLGGRFCLWCEHTDVRKFYKNEYMVRRAVSKFIKDNINRENSPLWA